MVEKGTGIIQKVVVVGYRSICGDDASQQMQHKHLSESK